MTNKPTIFKPEPGAILRYRTLADAGAAITPLFSSTPDLIFVILFHTIDNTHFIMASETWLYLDPAHDAWSSPPIWRGSFNQFRALTESFPLTLSLDK
jgi:hypothetical protein